MDMEQTFEAEKRSDCRYVIGFDPSQGLGKDYSVLVVVRQESDGMLVVTNVWRRNDFSPDRQADMIGEWCKKYGAPLAAEDVGFQRLFSKFVGGKGNLRGLSAESCQQQRLEAGFVNRLRVWFERGKIVFPYGDDATRRIVNQMLEELEAHAWKGGDITDKGRHNDTVMALAHAIDQFKSSLNRETPMIAGQTDMSQWNTAKSQKKRKSSRKYVAFW